MIYCFYLHVVPVIYYKIIHFQIKEGKNIIIAAHGNSLRGIVKHLDGMYHILASYQIGQSIGS